MSDRLVKPKKLDVGTVLGERYELVDQLGKGGMAKVYRARDIRLDREVAIKVLSPEYARKDRTLKRFVREARVMASLDSPYVIPIYDVGEDGPYTFLVMKLMESPVLDFYLERDGYVRPERASEWMSHVLVGLGHVHEKGLVHRDVKPSNIIVDAGGRALLLDLGIARDLGPEAVSGLTTEGVILGTPSYISPEQVAGKVIDERSDIYASGVVFFEMLTGELPFKFKSQVEACLCHLKRQPPSPREIRSSVPEPLAQVVLKAMEKDPDIRYQTALEMKEAISEGLREARRLGQLVSPSVKGHSSAKDADIKEVLATTQRQSRAQIKSADTGVNRREDDRRARRRLVWVGVLSGVAFSIVIWFLLFGLFGPPSDGASVAVNGAESGQLLESTGDILTDVPRLLASGAKAEALVLLQRAVRESPERAEYYALLGDAYDLSDDPEAAVAAYRRYLFLAPEGPEVKRIRQRLDALGGL